MEKIKDRKIVVINQASNYLTVGFCNAFSAQFESVSLITGSIHIQGEELNKNVKVTPINKWVERPASKKFWSYIKACLKIYWLLLTKYRKHEVFFVSIPPMGYLLNLLVSNRFSILVWDVYPDVFKITGMKENHFLYKTWASLNKKSFKKSFRLFTIGNKMADLLEVYVPRTKMIIQPIWSIFQANERVLKTENPFIKEHNLENKFIIQYSGNIGLTHKVEIVVEIAELLKDNKDIIFQIIGRGPRVPALQKMVEEKNLPNCMFLPFQSDAMFPFSLSAADLGIVILDELTSKGSVPSKSYNLMSYGIPSIYIAGEDSELHDYANQFKAAACFTERELQAAKNFILDLASNKQKWEMMSQNALETSKLFRRDNAYKFVELYLNSSFD
ncbi:MAG TPA: glycosyltransferase family 4 protein [Flavobacterium sp.]|jgi:glycosyltransferase involved in cell wall biosynthesis|uniref:glycosyltransferase family 4 protein n=1 Tax=Flavobacterium sp. TaxID=239 RepID=UPI002BAB15C5|nr:glycosyltransferase family 4 protein [Flavobacterium sp.]HPW98887.1 glycosyltransferase family 4 protein [Flavobacterium sp.]HQA73651.1 glycosyltransferase family 4 protein [Flavobacterium sp.]